MEAINLSSIASQPLSMETNLPPAAPEAGDITEFQQIYWGNAPGKTANGNPIFNLQGTMQTAATDPTFFEGVMNRIMEAQKKSEVAKDKLVDKLTGGGDLSEGELLQMQIAGNESAFNLSLFQSFDKKTEEGVKTLMTGQ